MVTEQDPSSEEIPPAPESSTATRSQRIKIGSQREDDDTGSPPVKRPESTDRDTATGSTSEQTETVASSVAPSVETEPEPEVSSLDGPESVSQYPPPRINRVSPDLQDEIDEALGDFSMDQLVDADSAGQPIAEGLETESRHVAVVEKIHRENIFFRLPGRNQGVAAAKQMRELPELGTEMEVVIVGLNRDDGLYELTIPGGSVSVADWADVTEGIVVDARITGHNSGGLECEVGSIRGFIPASQIDQYRVEDFSEFVDQKLSCLVTEANPARQNLVLSRRAVLEKEKEEAKQKLLESLEVGQTHEGIVRNIRDFGAFVDLGGVDGLIHISQLSWQRVNHPSEVLEEGQKVKVKIDKIDPASGKLSLSYRDLIAHPWENIEAKFTPQSIVKGTVSKIMDFGAFVQLEPGVEGLVHISELAHQRVHKVHHVVQEGQEVEVKVLSIDSDQQRMSLSLKAAQAAPASDDDSETAGGDESPESGTAAAPKRPDPATLKGGLERRSDGDRFGLKW